MINSPYSILEETQDFLVVFKNHSVPSAPGNTPNSCYELVAKDFPEISNVSGKKAGEGGLIHRLDTETAGLLLFAKNQKFYDLIIKEQEESRFLKYYTAYCSCFESQLEKIDLKPKSLTSFFRPFGEKGAIVKPIFNLETETKANKKKSGTKQYTTNILSIEKQLEKKIYGKTLILFKIKCSIFAGFRHQVRSHLASQNLPVFGDGKYNLEFSEAKNMLFFASGISFLGKNYSLNEDELDSIAAETFLASATR